MKLVLVAVFALLAVGFAKKDFNDLTDDDIRRIDEEWEEDGEIDPEDLPPWKRPEKEQPAMNMPNIQPGQAVDPSMLQQLQSQKFAGKPQMMFVTFKGNKKETNEKISGRFTSSLRQAHIEVKIYFLEDDKCIISIDDGKYAMQIIDFLKEQPEVVQIELDSKKYMPEHTKDRNSKLKQERETKEREAKEKRIRDAQKRLKKARRRRRRRSKDEL
eukprot:m.135585 g.135585  ORF g.135585 m.135585 type:complete len:215 (-) comp15997_c0_seq8:43-687(-)